MPFLEIIFAIIVLGVILWGVEQLPMDATFKQVVRVLCIVVMVVWVAYAILGLLGGVSHGGGLLFRCP